MTDLYTRHKPIRNKIRRFKSLSLIGAAVDKLHTAIDGSARPPEWGGYLPWNLLLLIRWVYQYSEPQSQPREIDERSFIDLLNGINDLRDSVRMEGQPEGNILPIFIRRMMFFQLPFQIRPYEIMSSFCRQIVMFHDMGANNNLNELFREITGIELQEYLELYMCCWAACDQGDIDKISTRYFQNQFPQENIRKFFSIVSLDLGGAKRFIRTYTDHPTRGGIDYQLNEHTPLERYPFLDIGERYACYSKKLLDSSIMYSVYDLFKSHNPNFSSLYFGKIFEQYLQKGLEYLGLPFLTESQIQGMLPRGTKATDFLVQCEEGTILIDAKSTELHPIARVLQSKESLLRNLESTVLHGVKQIFTVAAVLRGNSAIRNTNTFYGIVVTYKDYLIGDGRRFWDDVAGEYLQEWLRTQGITPNIPPENLFYISVEEYDYLMAALKENPADSLIGVLEVAKKNNQDPRTGGLMLKQHLDKIWGKYYRPAYLGDRGGEFFDTLKKRFPEVGSS